MEKQFTLHLDDVRHLFTAPDFDPFATHPRDVSGLDEILEELQTISRPDSLKTILYIPAEQITPELTDQVKFGIQQYSAMKTEQAVRDIQTLRRQGLRGLAYGALFLLVCLALAILAQQSTFLPEWLGGFLFNGFTVIGWVSLWHPSEMILFDWYPPRRDIARYKLIKAMEVEIKAA